jgi:hypothetical protein
MSNTPSQPHNWVVDEKTDKEKLKQLAINLERELEEASSKSKIIAGLANFEPLLSAIHRAQDGQIDKAEEIQGMNYWYLHTDLPGAISLVPTLSEFLFALECWRLEPA